MLIYKINGKTTGKPFYRKKSLSDILFVTAKRGNYGLPITFLRASTDFDSIVKLSEQALRKLEFRFIRNEHQTVVEFEITSPSYFRLVLEPNRTPKVRTLLIPSIGAQNGSTMDIRFDLDADEEDISLAMQHVRHFVRELIEVLPKKPWIGLDGWDAGREEKRWKDILR